MKKVNEKTIGYLFLITIAFLPLYLLRFEILGIPTNASEALALTSIAALLSYYRFDVRRKIESIPRFIIISIIIMIIGLSASLFFPGNFSLNGLGILKGWFLIPILFAFLALSISVEEKWKRKLVLALYLSSLGVSLISISYFLLGKTTYDGRLSAFYSSPNSLSMFLVFSAFSWTYLVSKQENVFFKKILRLSIVPIIFSLYLTLSYSVWLSATLSMIIARYIKGMFSVKLLASIAILASLFALQGDKERLLSLMDERSSLSSRIMIWKSSSKIIFDNPIFGIGPGNFQEKYLDYQIFFPPYLEWAVPHPHNIYFSFWLQAGILGLFAFLMLMSKILLALKKNKNTALSAALLASFLYILIHGLFDSTFWKNDLSYVFWMLVFLSIPYTNQKSKR